MRIEVFQNGELLKEFPWDGQPLWLGRGEECGVRLDDRAISRKHALIRSTENGITFEKKSKFGEARVDGREVDHALLQGNECLAFGPYEVRLFSAKEPGIRVDSHSIGSEPQAAALIVDSIPGDPTPESESPLPSDSSPIEADHATGPEQDIFAEGASPAAEEQSSGVPFESAPEIAEPVSGGGSEFDFSGQESEGSTRAIDSSKMAMKPILEFHDASGEGRIYEMVDPEIAIGRAANCHVILEDKKSSRKHVILYLKNGKYVLKDLGSSNGTQVNGSRVDEHELMSGDEIRVGDTRFSFKMVQADYEIKKAEFLQVPELPAPPMPMGGFQNPLGSAGEGGGYSPLDAFSELGSAQQTPNPKPVHDFTAPSDDKRTIIGKALDRFRAMPVRQQIIVGVVVLGAVYLYMDEDEVKNRATLQQPGQQKPQVKKADPKTSLKTFENLTREQQAYVDSEYQLAFDFYKNRDYDNCLLEMDKFLDKLVQDYKGAREIQSFARTGKRKLQEQEEDRKRKEQERQTQIKIQSLIDQAGLMMDQKNYKGAEKLFPEIDLLQPENSVVSAWRKRIVEEVEKNEKDEIERGRIAKLNQEAWTNYAAARRMKEEKSYFSALDLLDSILEVDRLEAGLKVAVKVEISKIEQAIAVERDPLLEKGHQLEKEENYSEAYRAYRAASKIDPTDTDAPAGMNRIKGVLNARAKSIYSEAVIAESFSDFDTAEKKYKEVLDVVPPENDYFSKATNKIKRLSALKKLGGSESPK